MVAEQQMELLNARRALHLSIDTGGLNPTWAAMLWQTAVLWSVDWDRRELWLRCMWAVQHQGELSAQLAAEADAVLRAVQP